MLAFFESEMCVREGEFSRIGPQESIKRPVRDMQWYGARLTPYTRLFQGLGFGVVRYFFCAGGRSLG